MTKKPETPTRQQALARLEAANDALGAQMSEHFLVTLAAAALAESDKAREAIVTYAAAGHWLGEPEAVAGTRLNMLVAQFSDKLPLIAISGVLERSGEVADARLIIQPLTAERDLAREELAAVDKAACQTRSALESKLASALAAAENDPEVVRLRRELDSILP